MERPSTLEPPGRATLPLPIVVAILNCVEEPLILTDGSGHLCARNSHAERFLKARGLKAKKGTEIFSELFRMVPGPVVEQMRSGEREVSLPLADPNSDGARARLHWIAELGWMAVIVESGPSRSAGEDAAMQQTLGDLLQEREVTYRNLLAAYLRLQEVNRQKTVFLASAAHELKTPLAVMKGYHDLLLSGSLGKLADKQKDMLSESKESCERLIRLVSMFLNYSALESGKLAMHLRKNDPRDCLNELGTLWRDAFARNQVRLELRLSGGLEAFRFDYQKVQQTVANLLDNALKHTPSGGHVTLQAEEHFWERRAASVSPHVERRHGPESGANSLLVSVTDSGPGIAPEHHQEIFEDFVRVDRSSSGMGLGLAISKRLVQAHRGKIWVDSEVGRGCTVKFLLPMDLE
ncbi:MAG TPA: HAMP domain-containing sensor histidine kinase [Candidatus Acidoferrales bacterium]|nr:HAMP domain-containing sensor histidine kinase [Candidatus Acidoferrales bacterium]